MVWPSISTEPRDWASRFDEDVSRRQASAHRGPYQASIVPAIAGLEIRLPGALEAQVGDASTALVQFDSELGSLSLPFAAILLRSESASSSQIEQLTSGARAIAEAAMGERDTGNAALIVRNVQSVQAALELSDSIDNKSIIEMQRALLQQTAPEQTGRYRDEQVWIGGSGVGPHGADFIPPHPDRVPAGMDDLIDFVHRTDISVLTHVAITHAQFETIHPFPDGNGRTGRALAQAQLRESGLTSHATVPISAGLLSGITGYYAALTAYRAGRVEPIVEAFADAAFAAVTNGRRLVTQVTDVRATWQHRMAGLRMDATARRVATLALEQPALNQRLVTERLGVTPMSAYRALDALTERGVLRTSSSAKRNRIWLADEILTALDDFAERAGRRGNRA